MNNFEYASSNEFEVFKSNVKHMIKEMGQLDFIKYILLNDLISKFWEEKCTVKALYLLATVDYLSKINNIPIYNKYDKLRHYKMQHPVIPLSIAVMSHCFNESIDNYLQNSIPEFSRHNIMEGDLFDVV